MLRHTGKIISIIKYDNVHYSTLTYFINEDTYVLIAMDKDSFDNYSESGELEGFSEYTNHYVPDSSIEITKEELKYLYLRSLDYGNKTENGIELNFFSHFNKN